MFFCFLGGAAHLATRGQRCTPAPPHRPLPPRPPRPPAGGCHRARGRGAVPCQARVPAPRLQAGGLGGRGGLPGAGRARGQGLGPARPGGAGRARGAGSGASEARGRRQGPGARVWGQRGPGAQALSRSTWAASGRPAGTLPCRPRRPRHPCCPPAGCPPERQADARRRAGPQHCRAHGALRLAARWAAAAAAGLAWHGMAWHACRLLARRCRRGPTAVRRSRQPPRAEPPPCRAPPQARFRSSPCRPTMPRRRLLALLQKTPMAAPEPAPTPQPARLRCPPRQ